MFYIQLSEDKRLVRSQCEAFMEANGLLSEPINLQDACKATQNYRHAMGLQDYEPAIFIGLPTPADMPYNNTSIEIFGYWLFHGIWENEMIFVSVPAFLDAQNKYQPLLPQNGIYQNPAGLELRIERPCPPPPPCPDASILTTDALYMSRFPNP